MNLFAWVNLVLSILTGVAGQLPRSGTNLKILAELQAAIEALQRVFGSEDTREQLESLRWKPKW